MNETIQTILNRRSVKSYKPDAVPERLLSQIAEAGTYAATGRNLQSPIILVVTKKETRDKLSKLNAAAMGASGDPFYGAPAVLVVLVDKSVRTGVYDGSIVMANMMLAAESLGLGSCWIHRAKETFETPDGKAILSSLGIKGEYEGIGNCIVGYADGEKPVAKPRKENWVYYIK